MALGLEETAALGFVGLGLEVAAALGLVGLDVAAPAPGLAAPAVAGRMASGLHISAEVLALVAPNWVAATPALSKTLFGGAAASSPAVSRKPTILSLGADRSISVPPASISACSAAAIERRCAFRSSTGDADRPPSMMDLCLNDRVDEPHTACKVGPTVGIQIA